MHTASRRALRRLAHLGGKIRAGNYPNATSVARELEVHPRTIHRDLEFLRDSRRAPLEYCRRRGAGAGGAAADFDRLREGPVDFPELFGLSPVDLEPQRAKVGVFGSEKEKIPFFLSQQRARRRIRLKKRCADHTAGRPAHFRTGD
jgi:hypothetical protein